MTGKKRIVILVSGRGSNMEALIAAAAAPDFPAEVAGVISNDPGAPGLATARSRGIEAICVAHRDHPDRAAHEAALSEALAGLSPDLVCLAGYMRILTADFVAAWAGRMINIHPSLLPAFPGLDTHARALEAGVRIHGCTVHFVNEKMDDGPIIAQAAVPVLADDSEKTLAERVLAAEHRLYPMALSLIARGTVRLENGRTVLETVAGAADAGLYSPPIESARRAQEADLEHLARFTP